MRIGNATKTILRCMLSPARAFMRPYGPSGQDAEDICKYRTISSVGATVLTFAVCAIMRYHALCFPDINGRGMNLFYSDEFVQVAALLCCGSVFALPCIRKSARQGNLPTALQALPMIPVFSIVWMFVRITRWYAGLWYAGLPPPVPDWHAILKPLLGQRVTLNVYIIGPQLMESAFALPVVSWLIFVYLWRGIRVRLSVAVLCSILLSVLALLLGLGTWSAVHSALCFPWDHPVLYPLFKWLPQAYEFQMGPPP